MHAFLHQQPGRCLRGREKGSCWRNRSGAAAIPQNDRQRPIGNGGYEEKKELFLSSQLGAASAQRGLFLREDGV